MGQSLLTSSGASDCPYNVGDIYITTLNTNPQDIWQNTVWEKIKDKFLLGAGDTYSIGSSGGEATHTLTVDEMPKHRHEGLEWTSSENIGLNEGTGATIRLQFIQGSSVPGFRTVFAGNNLPHNNMPPYLCVNMWIRTE